MDYYVYVYLDQTHPGEWIYKNHTFYYKPFYVGKGTKNRENEHLRPYMLNKKSYKNSVIKSIIKKTGESPIHYRLYENISNEESISIEKDFITHFGRLDNNSGILTNCTDGGDGANNFSIEVLKKVGNKPKKIFQYSLSGEFIKEWDKIGDIDVIDTVANIPTSIKRNGTCGGFIWSYTKYKSIPKKKKSQQPTHYKDIKQINIVTNEIINIFDDALSIEVRLNLRKGARNKIYECLNNKIKTAYGFKWKI